MMGLLGSLILLLAVLGAVLLLRSAENKFNLEYFPWTALGLTEAEYWKMRYIEERKINAEKK